MAFNNGYLLCCFLVLFVLKKQMFHDICLQHKLECLGGTLDNLQSISMKSFCWVEDYSSFYPFRSWNNVWTSPANRFQFLHNRYLVTWPSFLCLNKLTQASSTVIFSPPRFVVDKAPSSPPFLAYKTLSKIEQSHEDTRDCNELTVNCWLICFGCRRVNDFIFAEHFIVFIGWVCWRPSDRS